MARQLGLGDAHRFWFGLPDARTPLFRADLAPAGFIASTASDLARPIEMILAAGRTRDGNAFLTPAGVAALTTRRTGDRRRRRALRNGLGRHEPKRTADHQPRRQHD